MIIKKIYIEKNEASCEEICSFIHEVDKDFITPISMKVDIENYSIKVKNNADIYTIKCNGRVIAMGICYTNDIKNGIAYLSFFAVSKENRKWGGYAQMLLQEIINGLKDTSMTVVRLHTENGVAEKLYKKNGFSVIENLDGRKMMELKIREEQK